MADQQEKGTAQDKTQGAAPAAKKVQTKVSGGKSTVSAEQADQNNQSMGQVRKSLIFIVAVMAIYVVYLVISGQFDDFVSSLRGADVRWILGGLLLYVIYYMLGSTSFALAVISSDKDSPVGFRDVMSVQASGILFMNLTPNGSGVLPAEIYRFTRAGLSVGEAGSVQYTRFVMYEAGEGIFAAIMLLFRGNYFYETFGNVTIIGLLLFGSKVIELAGILFISLCPNLVIRICDWGLGFALKHNWIKEEKHDKWQDNVHSQVAQFSSGFKDSATNVQNMIVTFCFTMVQLACLYSLPWFVLKSFGLEADLITCMASGSMLELLTSAIPLPGGEGGAEVGFAYLFSSMFGSHLSAGYVLWRSVEYLIPTLCMVPLMGLRSTSGEPIYRRWRRYGRKVRNLAIRIKRGGRPAAAVTVSPTGKTATTSKGTATKTSKSSAVNKEASAPKSKASPKSASPAKTKRSGSSKSSVTVKIPKKKDDAGSDK